MENPEINPQTNAYHQLFVGWNLNFWDENRDVKFGQKYQLWTRYEQFYYDIFFTFQYYYNLVHAWNFQFFKMIINSGFI